MARAVGVSERSKPTLEFGAGGLFVVILNRGSQFGQVLGHVPLSPHERRNRFGPAFGVLGVSAVQGGVCLVQ